MFTFVHCTAVFFSLRPALTNRTRQSMLLKLLLLLLLLFLSLVRHNLQY
jgi:hypothetical protein